MNCVSTLLDMLVLWRDAFMTALPLANILRPKIGLGRVVMVG